MNTCILSINVITGPLIIIYAYYIKHIVYLLLIILSIYIIDIYFDYYIKRIHLYLLNGSIIFYQC